MTQCDEDGNRHGRTVWRCIFAVYALMIAAGSLVFLQTLKPAAPTADEARHVVMPTAPESQTPEPRFATAEEIAATMGGEVAPDDPQAREVEKVGNYLVANSTAGASPYKFSFTSWATRRSHRHVHCRTGKS